MKVSLTERLKLWWNEKKQNKNLKILIRFFVFRHLFPAGFLANKRPEKLANIFGSYQNHFCSKKHFLIYYIVSPSVFPQLQDIRFKYVAKRVEFINANKKSAWYYHVTYGIYSESALYSLPECQGTHGWKQAPYLKFKWQERDSNQQPLSL